MEIKMNKDELIKLIESIKIDKSEFTILSTTALVLRGIYESARDLDIAVTKKGLEQLRKNYNLVKKDEEWYIVTDKVECILDEMNGKKEEMDGYNLQDINDYLDFLTQSDREKDKARIPLVKEYISKRLR